QLCIGEYDQLYNRFNFDLTLDQYIEKSRSKTALLMATCLQTGAEAADAEAQTVQLLYEFGESLGIAFQIHDDVMDFIQSPERLGKPTGSDLRNGNVTLPVVYALELPESAARLRSLNARSSAAQFQQAVELIASSDAIDRCLELSSVYIDRCRAIIEKLSRHSAHRDLE